MTSIVRGEGYVVEGVVYKCIRYIVIEGRSGYFRILVTN